MYPREPKNKKKVGKGNSANKTYYFTKDIQFLQHEPLIIKFRQIKVFFGNIHTSGRCITLVLNAFNSSQIFIRRLKKATAKKEDTTIQRLKDAQPELKIDHIVKER